MVPPQTCKREHVWTSQPMASGVEDLNGHTSMWEFFNPHAKSHWQSSLSTCYRKQEGIKKRAYEQRIREVEHSSFTPLVFSATGGMANEATAFYKRLASCLATKWDQSYSSTMSWLRCRLTFSLLRSAIQCIYTWYKIKHWAWLLCHFLNSLQGYYKVLGKGPKATTYGPGQLWT